MKKLTAPDLKLFRDLLQIPVTDDQIEEDAYSTPYYHPGPDAPEITYMLERRRQLGGFVPERRNKPGRGQPARGQDLRGLPARARASRWRPPRWPSSGCSGT